MGSLRENPVYRSQPFTKEEEEMFSGTLKEGKDFIFFFSKGLRSKSEDRYVGQKFH